MDVLETFSFLYYEDSPVKPMIPFAKIFFILIPFIIILTLVAYFGVKWFNKF